MCVLLALEAFVAGSSMSCRCSHVSSSAATMVDARLLSVLVVRKTSLGALFCRMVPISKQCFSGCTSDAACQRSLCQIYFKSLLQYYWEGHCLVVGTM
jgi:hypothetical protein